MKLNALCYSMKFASLAKLISNFENFLKSIICNYYICLLFMSDLRVQMDGHPESFRKQL